MQGRKLANIALHSIFAKFMFVFLLFGGLLVFFTISIQNDQAKTTTENQTKVQLQLSLSVLEEKLGEGDWHISNHVLYKGDTVIGNGSEALANIAPFVLTQQKTDSFVYSFIDSSYAEENLLSEIEKAGECRTPFLRVAGSTRSAEGNSIVGTFLEQDISDQLIANEVYSGESYVEGRLYYCYYRVISDEAGSRVGAVVAGRSIEEVTDNARKSVLNASLAIVVMILYTFFAILLFVARWNRSIRRTEKYLTDIGKGQFPEQPLRISGGDELSEMADVINEMKDSLQERERIRSELELARTIQAEMLPDEACAKRLPKSCEVHGFMKAAKEVGGDLYDFFMINDDLLGIVIADVSDKGVPAALFMSTAKMCIKENMMLGASPKDVMEHVNNRLLENNKFGLFVTAWIGELNLKTGHLQYVAAGHPFPFLGRSKTQDYQPLESSHNLILAGMPNYVYEQAETDLQPGDRLFLYTDGLDEARDANRNFFGKERIKEYLDRTGSASVSETISGMEKTVDDFAHGCMQFDDLTMLMVEYRGEEDV